MMPPLDKAAAVGHMLRSRWRVTIVDAVPGVGRVDPVYDEGHEGPVGALMAAMDTFAAAYPGIDVNALEYRIVPVHREDEIAGVPA